MHTLFSNQRYIMFSLTKFITGLSLIAAVTFTGCSAQNDATSVAEVDDVTLTSFEQKKDPQAEQEPLEEIAEINAKELAALDQMVDGLVSLAKNNGAQANAKLQMLFAAADDSKDLAPMAEHAANRIISEADGTDSAQFAKSYLILTRLRDHSSSEDLYQELAEFANDYPTSNRPIQLYKQLSDRLVAKGDSKTAIALLDHGVRHCEANRDVEPLKKQKRMMVQLAALMSRPNSTGKPPIQPKKSRTKEDSPYHAFVGKRLRPTGETLKGSSLSSQQLQGEWVYVHFWATWCGACRSDMPAVAADKKRLAKYGVKFVGLNLDDDVSAAKKYVQKERIDWPQISGAKAESLASSLGVKSIPACFLVGPDGRIIEAGQSNRVTKSARYHLK